MGRQRDAALGIACARGPEHCPVPLDAELGQRYHDAMFAVFLTPAYLPFAITLVVMIGIGVIEAIGLGLGELDLGIGVMATPTASAAGCSIGSGWARACRS